MTNSVLEVMNSRYLWDIQRGCLTGYASLRLYMTFMKIKCGLIYIQCWQSSQTGGGIIGDTDAAAWAAVGTFLGLSEPGASRPQPCVGSVPAASSGLNPRSRLPAVTYAKLLN